MSASDVITGMKRGVGGRCPQCGQGKLFRKYLKVRATCDVCGHDNASYPADDAPPYFTILIVGHLFVGPLVFFPAVWRLPLEWLIPVGVGGLGVIASLLLPHIKGAVIGLQWAIRRGEVSETPG